MTIVGRDERIRAKLTSHDKQIFDPGKMAEVGNGGLGLC